MTECTCQPQPRNAMLLLSDSCKPVQLSLYRSWCLLQCRSWAARVLRSLNRVWRLTGVTIAMNYYRRICFQTSGALLETSLFSTKTMHQPTALVKRWVFSRTKRCSTLIQPSVLQAAHIQLIRRSGVLCKKGSIDTRAGRTEVMPDCSLVQYAAGSHRWGRRPVAQMAACLRERSWGHFEHLLWLSLIK